MKTFSNIKRELRTLYKPKGVHKARAKTPGARNTATETIDNGSAIQLSQVSSTPSVQKTEEKKDPKADGHGVKPEVDPQSLSNEDNESSPQVAEAEIGDAEPAREENTQGIHNETSPEDESRSREAEAGDSQSFEGEPEGHASEDPEFLSLEEAQAIRNRQYVSFKYEAPEDYTEGPPRFICGFDGIKEDCVALLMTFDLSTAIQTAIHGQRSFARASTAGLMKRQSLLRLERDVMLEISSCKSRLARLETQENVTDGQATSEEAQKQYQQRANLELMLEDVHIRLQHGRTNVKVYCAERLRRLQAEVGRRLEEAFVAAKLMAPEEEEEESEMEELDVEREYQEFCKRRARVHDGPFEVDVMPLDVSRKHLEAEPLTEEQEAHKVVLDDLYALREGVNSARAEFNSRDTRREQEFKENLQAGEEEGGVTTHESREAFDVRWVVHNQRLTRNLIDAEAAYAAKKREVFEAGIPVPFTDAGSEFGGTVGSVVEGLGYEPSIDEQEVAAPKPSPTVRRWLSKVPEGAEAGGAGDEARSDADEWEAEEVGISDSVSLVAEGRERARIDRWRNACLERRKE
ncbi:hypothetical protein Q7P37_003747 [Cladosporium fusiforme]